MFARNKKFEGFAENPCNYNQLAKVMRIDIIRKPSLLSMYIHM